MVWTLFVGYVYGVSGKDRISKPILVAGNDRDEHLRGPFVFIFKL